MDKIKQQVAHAHRRLIVQQFLSVAAWWMFSALLIAAIGVAVPKLFPLAVDKSVWLWSWLGGSLGAGLLGASLWTYFTRRSSLDAAIEIDRRFGLKERISSALSLEPGELDSEVGRALVNDAVQRVERIDVRDHFPVRANWRALLPLMPAAVIFVLAIGVIPDATRDEQANAALTQAAADRARVEKSAQELQKRLAEVKKKAEQEGLENADELFQELQKGLEELANKSNVDRKQALVKINDMAKELEKRRQEIGGAEKLREQLKSMKDLQQGPAEKIAQAMKEGQFGKAVDELKKLEEKLAGNQMTEEEKKQLEEQLQQLKDKLEGMVDAHNEAKQDLERAIEKKLAAGDVDGANKLLQQLDKLNQMNQQMDQLKQMAQQLGQCKECMQNGEMQNAGQQLAKLGDKLQELQAQLDQLETLDEILDQIADAKDAMNCQQCNGQGCEACMGGKLGQNGMQQQQPGFGMGEGQGQGDRPEEKDNTSFYESRVRGEPQQGEAVRTGSAGGPNRAGKTLENVKQTIQSNLSTEADPLIDGTLPRKERDHAKQYFDRFRQ